MRKIWYICIALCLLLLLTGCNELPAPDYSPSAPADADAPWSGSPEIADAAYSG